MDKTIDRLRDSMDKSMDRSIDKSIDLTGTGDVEYDGKDDTTQAPIIKLVASIIPEAVRNRASGIHIEPMKDRIRLR